MKKAIKRTVKRRIRRHGKPGTAPGTIIAHPDAELTEIRVVGYNENEIFEQVIVEINELDALRKKWPNLWIDISGLASTDKIQQLGAKLKLHPLALEDAVNVHQRSKVDEYSDHLFIVARMCNAGEGHVTEQISLFLLPGVLVTFQERKGDCWDAVRARIRLGRNNLRSHGLDYLTYALLDATIDSYFPPVDSIGDQLDAYDEAFSANEHNKDESFHQLHQVRHQLLSLRRSLRPHRDMINELIRDEHALISSGTRVFFRDCFDHTIQLLDLVDTYRELTADLREFHLSLASTRMNEIMKVLTVISTIFIPLSFIAGLYGMNFETRYPLNMPELRWQYGYPFSLFLMLATAGSMLYYFKRKGWF